MTPSWGKYFMKKCLSTFDIPKESAAGVSGEAHSAYSDASALLSPQSRQEQERSDCSLGAEDRKKGLIFLEEAHECFQGGENSPTSALGLRKSWWSVWDTQELSLAPSRKNRRHLGWVCERAPVSCHGVRWQKGHSVWRVEFWGPRWKKWEPHNGKSCSQLPGFQRMN